MVSVCAGILVRAEQARLDEGQDLDESLPAWSPDGAWIASVRREVAADPPGGGSQVWLVRPDGAEAHPITQDEATIHGEPAWSPDGRYLLYDVTPITQSALGSRIVVFDVESGDAFDVTSSGGQPAWLW